MQIQKKSKCNLFLCACFQLSLRAQALVLFSTPRLISLDPFLNTICVLMTLQMYIHSPDFDSGPQT